MRKLESRYGNAASLLAGLVLGIIGQRYLNEVRTARPQRVNVADIPKDVALVGGLQVPLLTAAKISGRWRSLPDDVNKGAIGLAFVVEEVSGRKLRQPAVYFRHDIQVADRAMFPQDDELLQDPIDGSRWSAMAYETGRYDGQPLEMYEYRGTPLRYIPRNYRFVCLLNLFDITAANSR
jgi:hypothetical protein